MTLLGPRDLTTRPVTDRVKESLFSILGNDIIEARVADLFCGTGSMGLEALSRGAAWAIMVDKDQDALLRLRKNIAKLRFEERTCIRKVDAFRYGVPDVSGRLLPDVLSPTAAELSCTMVFVDPPYMLSRKTDISSRLGKLLVLLSEQVSPNAQVIIRHEARYEFLTQYDALYQFNRRDYKNMAVTFFRKADPVAS